MPPTKFISPTVSNLVMACGLKVRLVHSKRNRDFIAQGCPLRALIRDTGPVVRATGLSSVLFYISLFPYLQVVVVSSSQSLLLLKIGGIVRTNSENSQTQRKKKIASFEVNSPQTPEHAVLLTSAAANIPPITCR